MKFLSLIFIALILGAVPAAAQETVTYFIVNWSPDSKYVSFTEMRNSGPDMKNMKADICVARADGMGELKKITGDPGREFGASWAADGKRIFFGSSPADDPKKSELFSAKADGSDPRQLTKGTMRSSAPEVSPDGRKLVFNGENVEHKPQIYLINTDGSGLKALTEDTTLAFFNPVWSPDGKKIVYYVEKGDQKDQVWVMNADGGGKTLLTGNIGHNFYPTWSADGKRIVFSSKRDDAQALYSMKADGSDIKRMEGIESFYLRYSPDGKKIAFISGKFPNTNVVVANVDGSSPVNITSRK
jgi:TolB protein